MKVERNDPCPCGSGKKYKKCCGASLAPTRPDYFAFNRAVAYKGVVGRRREAFCVSYTALKKAKIAEMGDTLKQEVSPSGGVISCCKGCMHCCKYPVDASLQECECIVYYLYQHEEVLRHFLQAFDGWRDRILRIELSFHRLNNLQQKITACLATEREMQLFNEECYTYGLADILCPFLAEGACSIYEVRPYACAGLVATTPKEWCNPSHPRIEQVQNFKVQLELGTDMPYFAKPKSNCIFSSLPFMVYRILEEGYDALSSVPGLEKLNEAAFSDPEVQVILASRGLFYPI